MTPQTKLALVGLATFAVSKFYFGHDNKTAALYGTTIIALVAVVTWPDTTPNP